MKRVRMLLLLVTVLLSAAAGLTPPAHAQVVSCSDCISLCLLKDCGFFESPACVSAHNLACDQQCTKSGSC
jgi:hypothetical protein